MTRFLMTLSESVDLVFYAFQSNESGNIYVKKSPSCTIFNLVKALGIIFNHEPKIKIIGTRHGEKLYESLLSREEILRVQETEKHYIIPIDERDLNYNRYFVEGSIHLANLSDYTSHNAQRLDLEQVMGLLMKVQFIKEELKK